MVDDICLASASDLIELYRGKQISPVEVLKSFHEKADALEPSINAFTEQLRDGAALEAIYAEKAYRNTDPEDFSGLPALLGVPVATKEKHFLKGHRIELGLRGNEERRAEFDHPVIERLKNAGAVVHARTTTPEFSCATVTHSLLWGVTRNPWNLQYSPGGSSGGSGAALAAGMTTLATASDIAGSTRIPACFTGTVGYKAPYGRVPAESELASDWYRGDGPMGRTVDDVARLMNVLSGRHHRDPNSLPKSDDLVLSDCGDTRLRVAVCVQLGNYPVDRDVVRNTHRVADALRELGHIVDEIELDWSREEIHQAAFTHFGNILAPGLRAAAEAAGDISLYAQSFLEEATRVAADHTLYSSLQIEYRYQQDIARVFRSYDALICPTSASAVLEADENYTTGISVGDVKLEHYWESHMTLPFNLANRCPVLAIPSGYSRFRVPTGVQVVAAPFDESTVFQIGRQLEKTLPWAHSYQELAHGSSKTLEK